MSRRFEEDKIYNRRTDIHAKFDDRAGGAHAWKLRRDLLSKHHTTSWDELPEIVHKGAVYQR